MDGAAGAQCREDLGMAQTPAVPPHRTCHPPSRSLDPAPHRRTPGVLRARGGEPVLGQTALRSLPAPLPTTRDAQRPEGAAMGEDRGAQKVRNCKEGGRQGEEMVQARRGGDR